MSLLILSLDHLKLKHRNGFKKTVATEDLKAIGRYLTLSDTNESTENPVEPECLSASCLHLKLICWLC